MLLAVLGLLLLLLAGPLACEALSLPAPQLYSCDGEPLQATLVRGPVDAPELNDPSDGLVPVGASVLLTWRDLRLQLPRTNNAGPASFSDGRWWWSLEDPERPRLRQRSGTGAIRDFACRAQP